MKPGPKADLLKGAGHFFKPHGKVFTETWTEVRRAPVSIGKTCEVYYKGSWRLRFGAITLLSATQRMYMKHLAYLAYLAQKISNTELDVSGGCS